MELKMKLKFFSTFFEFIQSQSLNIEIEEVLAFLGNSQKPGISNPYFNSCGRQTG